MPGRATPPMPLSWPRAMVQQGVDQRVLLVAGRRMHHQPRRLVQHQQGIVLVQDVQRHLLRLGLGGPGFGPVHFDLSPRRAAYAWA